MPMNKWMLFIAVGITVTITILALQKNLQTTQTPQTTPVNSIAPSMLSTEDSTNELRKRPKGTENWQQYVNKKNNIAFLYPQGFFTKEQEIGDNLLVVGLYLSNLADKNSLLLITVSEGSLDKKVSKYLNVKWNPSWKGDFQKLADTAINEQAFIGYNMTSTYEPTHETYNSAHYFTQRNNEVIEFTFRDIAGYSLKAEEFFHLLLLDGSRFEN